MLLMDVSYKTLHKHLKHTVLGNSYLSFKADQQRLVWLSHISLMATQSLQLYRRRQPLLSSPSVTSQCTDLTSGTVTWSTKLTQGLSNQQIRESGKKPRSMERGVARQLGESFSFLWQEFTVVESTYLTTA